MTAYFDRRAQALDEVERRWRGGDLSALYPDYGAARDTTRWDPMRPEWADRMRRFDEWEAAQREALAAD